MFLRLSLNSDPLKYCSLWRGMSEYPITRNALLYETKFLKKDLQWNKIISNQQAKLKEAQVGNHCWGPED